MSRILVIDDDMLVRRSLSRLFTDKGHDVLLAENLAQGVAAAETGVDIVYLDLDLPDGDGLRAIDELGMSPWRPEVIVITGMGAHYGAQRTMESNAWDYLSKPATPQKVIDSLESALTYRREVKNRPVAAGTPDKLGILGESSVMRRTMAEIGKTAASDAAVLIRGETGVGKELAARAIHENSRKRKGPFVVVDCSNLSESLVESILYGHAKGAYTGAHLSRMGLIAEADGGTLFLDEVGELPLSLQKSFLRVLQERSFRPLGDNREQTSDFRLVAATNKDLDKMVERSLFRSDLLFRLRTVELTLPPLRDRGDDRKLLARHFVDLTCKRYAITPVKVISDALLQVVLDYSWPGNIRELQNVMEAAVIQAGSDPVIHPKHLPAHVRLSCLGEPREHSGEYPGEAVSPAADNPVIPAGDPFPRYEEYKTICDGRYFAQLLQATEGNIPEAGKIAGLSVPTIYRYLARTRSMR